MDKWILQDKNYKRLRKLAMERKLGQMFLDGKLQPESRNTLIFDRNKLHAVYISPFLTKYQFKFKKKTNAFRLLEYLTQHPKEVLPVEELVKCLNEPRMGSESATPDRRVRDTIKELRSMSGLFKNKEDDCFIVGKGFGLKCSVVFI